jgi:hypothetical protein
VKLASQYDRIHQAGAELAAVSVDDDARQAGMSERWGFTHTRFVSDPGGETYLQPLDLFNPEERGGIALPGMVIVTPDGEEVYRYQGRDFADRTNDDDIWKTLDELQLPAVDPAPWVPTADVPDDLTGYFRPKDFAPTFRGNHFGAKAIELRLEGPESKAIAKEHRLMSKSNLEAWADWSPHTR